MGSYSVRLKRSAEKDLRRIEKSRVPSIIVAIQGLGQNPRPEGSRKLVGSESSYRIRIGDYRVVYLIEDTICIVEVERVRHRKDVYR
ncbi:type II toxin-antitoxin system RelE family toxin [Cerasicoccus fimbriatus]|uniref:type II toxin-antitoxin system RelE family toxin n=1 Tax=Cerasicoccus fimbriatus TaxID=3014554 RepID=UPI003CCE52D6